MQIIYYAIFFSLVGGVFSLVGGIILLYTGRKLAKGIIVHLLSFAAGAMIATTFLDILPEALDHTSESPSYVLFWSLIGFSLFFILETIFLWFHHHHPEIESLLTPHIDHNHSHAPILLTVGDSIHNFLDGIAIGAAFMTDFQLGIVTSIAIAAHEIPSEMGDFMIMLHAGWSRHKVLLANILSSLLSTAGAVLMVLIGSVLNKYVGIMLAMTAGFFLYIAAADLVPEI